MTKTLNIAVLGADGRMGQAVISALTRFENLKLACALTHSQSPHIGQEAQELAGLYGQDECVLLTSDFEQASDCDVVIDFSAPVATLECAKRLQGTSLKAIISGTTGFTETQNASLHAQTHERVLLQSGNFSLGVNMLEALVELTANKLRKGWDIDILEMHHRHKVDAPSGTALMLGEAAAKGRGVELKAVQRLSREGQTGARPEGEIGFATLRGGGVIGEHSAMIASELEMLTLSHSAFDRSVFANGAIEAAIWAVEQSPGHYTMKDMLGLT